MLPFLSKFLRNFPAVQTKQILKKISQARQRGEIVNEKDLKEQLTKLANVTSEEELKMQAPFLFFYEGDVLESDALKTFIESVQLDTEACLGEVEHLGDAVRAHHRILVDHYFNMIDASISELEKQVKGYELLALNRYRGFNKARVYDFGGSISVPGIGGGKITGQGDASQVRYGGEQRVLRTQNEISTGPNKESNPSSDTNPAGYLRRLSRKKSILESVVEAEQNIDPFVDKRSNDQTLFWSPPAVGEQGVRLAISEQNFHKFKTIGLVNDGVTVASGTRNEENENPDGNEIENTIDGKPETTWEYSVKSIELVDTCSIKLFLNFAVTKRINAVSVDPVSEHPMVLTAVSYLNSGENEVSVSVAEQVLKPSSKTIIELGDITAKGVFLTFQQPTATEKNTVVGKDRTGKWKVPESNREIFDWLYDHQQLSEILGNAEGDEVRIHFWNYSFGFKDILAIARTFEENGVFVPEVFFSRPITSLSLYTNIDYPESEYSDVEFLIRKENFTGLKELEDIEVFPILPVGTSTLNERLFLTQQVSATTFDAGRLRFYPDFTQSFNVYSNDSLLTIGIDYEISIDSGNTWETTFSFSGTADKTPVCLVKVLTPRTDKIFTVVYSALISTQSSGGEVFVNDEKTVVLERNETYVFDNNRVGRNNVVASNAIMLQVIVRSNTLNDKVTPYLKDFVLLTGTE